MKSLWSDAEAAKFEAELRGPLALRVYTSRLLGRDKSLVLHGGGNTSLKLREKNLFGEDEEVLYVKGSGWDLETIEPGGFSPVALAYVRRLASLERLSDRQMMNELNTHVLRAGAPSPSVETILHAILPHPYVDHTHADAVLSISNAPGGAERIREIYGERVVVIPYMMAGFDLAAHCAREFPKAAGKGTVGMVLLSHGIFSFGKDARESYERMIELVTMAERYLEKKKAWQVSLSAPRAKAPSRLEIAELRRSLSGCAPFPLVVQTNASEKFRAFAGRADIAKLSQQGPATPDHLLYTKPVPLIGRDVAGYARRYADYFRKHAAEDKVMLDPAPRVVLDPELGLASARRNAPIGSMWQRPDFLGVACDLTDAAAVEKSLDAALMRFGGIDMLMLNAGIFPSSQPLAEIAPETWQRTMTINVEAQLRLMQLCHPLLKLAPRGGRVVVIGSRDVPAPRPRAAAGSPSKAA